MNAAVSSAPIRLGVVSFLNTLPLIDGLDNLADLELRHTVPSRLLDLLLRDEVELALCSSIDYQRSDEPLVVVPCGLLGSDGPTLTVRLYSGVPFDGIDCVHCDTDSHTSVVLLRILLRELHDVEVRTRDHDARAGVWPEAVMLIGDKVVTGAPPDDRYPHQLDLGAAWTGQTGLPFVFALWMARRGTDQTRLRTASAILDRQRRHNRERLDRIVHHKAVAGGWPRALAREYLRDKLAFELTEPRRRGLELFFDKAVEHGLVERRRPLEVV